MIKKMKERKEELGYTYEQIAGLEDLPDMICEPESAYKSYMEKKQGEYTVEDYLAWPEEERIELIDGVIYDMAAPTDVHQIIVLELSTRFREHIHKNKGQCVPVISPIDVQLDEDDKTMVQPDVVILCDRNKFKNGRIFGAPDLIVEVLSPSTRRKDMAKKLSKYFAAGVREYWIVDPKDKKVLTYTNMDKASVDVTIYSFDSKIPVGIFEGKYEMDFAEIYDYISFLYEE